MPMQGGGAKNPRIVMIQLKTHYQYNNKFLYFKDFLNFSEVAGQLFALLFTV